MLAVVNTPGGPEPVAIREVPEPAPRPNEALVAVHAFSLNRGELRLFQVRSEGWRPGQDIAGVILKAAPDGSGPTAGTRVVGLCDWHGWAERAHVLDGLGAAEIVTRIEDTEGRFALILESAGGASLKAAIERIDHRGTVVIFGNSSGEPAELNFRDFAEHQNARIQAFHYFTSEPEERFGADLGLLAGLIADGTLKPRIVEHGWRELPRTGPRLLARQIPGKAIFLIDQK